MSVPTMKCQSFTVSPVMTSPPTGVPGGVREGKCKGRHRRDDVPPHVPRASPSHVSSLTHHHLCIPCTAEKNGSQRDCYNLSTITLPINRNLDPSESSLPIPLTSPGHFANSDSDCCHGTFAMSADWFNSVDLHTVY